MKHLFVFAASMALAAAAGAQTKWDMPTPYGDGEFHTINVRQYAEDVKKASGGQLEINVHSNGSLIKHPDIMRAVSTGQVSIAEFLLGQFGNEEPIFNADNMPFLAAGYDNAWKLYQAQKSVLQKKLEGRGMRLLYSVAWPGQGIYSKNPLKSVDDLKGTKFRTYSPTTSRFAELVGAIPTTIQVPDIPQAFRTGLVDAMITSGATGVDSQAWDYLQYYYDTQAFLPQNMVIVNKAAFGKLLPNEQNAVLDAAKAAEPRGWKTSESENAGYVKTMGEHGIKIMKPSSQLSSDFEKIGRQMADEWAKKAGAEGEAILKAYRGK